MSLSREIQQSLQNENNTTKTDSTIESTKQIKESINVAIGITAKIMNETIVHDICMMIDKGQRHSLDGYIFCLSRIISHEKAWALIQSAYQEKNETMPGKYTALFQNAKQKKPIVDKPHVAH